MLQRQQNLLFAGMLHQAQGKGRTSLRFQLFLIFLSILPVLPSSGGGEIARGEAEDEDGLEFGGSRNHGRVEI